ncbi:MAG TPA: hypothetical protein DCS93_36225 [Microscillaceae bacterium]|nr:hypothetical protein [Microscillaceae bacterium]
MKNKYNLVTTLLLYLSITHAALSHPAGYNYYKVVTIDATQVAGASNFTDFPVLISITDPDLRHTSSGGKVENLNGTDLLFTLSDETTVLEREIERYNSATGQLICWVKVPTLMAATNTVIHLYYGNGCVATAATNVWTNNYAAVLHLNEDPSGTAPQMQDSSPNTNAGTTQGSMLTANSVAGAIANGVSFDEVDDAIAIPDFDYTNANAFSVSFWFNVADNTGNSFQYMFSHGNFGVNHSLNIYFGEASLAFAADQNMLKTIFQDANDATNTNGHDAGNTLADGNWHYYTFSVSSPGNPIVYIDGVAVANISFQGGQTFDPTSNIFLGARSDLNTTRFYGGMLDELRISSTNRSADFILTEYRNQSSPNTFYSIGSENNTGDACSALPSELLDFEASLSEEPKVTLTWKTSKEINNDYFDIQRSADGRTWQAIGRVASKGVNIAVTNYETIDSEPLSGKSYYRLKQVELGGKATFSEIRSVNFTGVEIINSYPNPATTTLTIQTNSSETDTGRVTLYGISGQVMLTNQLSIEKGVNTFILDISRFAAGTYVLKVQTANGEYFDQVRVHIR